MQLCYLHSFWDLYSLELKQNVATKHLKKKCHSCGTFTSWLYHIKWNDSHLRTSGTICKLYRPVLHCDFKEVLLVITRALSPGSACKYVFWIACLDTAFMTGIWGVFGVLYEISRENYRIYPMPLWPITTFFAAAQLGVLLLYTFFFQDSCSGAWRTQDYVLTISDNQGLWYA